MKYILPKGAQEWDPSAWLGPGEQNVPVNIPKPHRVRITNETPGDITVMWNTTTNVTSSATFGTSNFFIESWDNGTSGTGTSMGWGGSGGGGGSGPGLTHQPMTQSVPLDPPLPRPPRGFNEYLNASNLMEEYIEELKELGITQAQFMALPTSLFINWLVLKAAEDAGEDPGVDFSHCEKCGKYTPKVHRKLGIPQCRAHLRLAA